jgi:hypothetical protein
LLKNISKSKYPDHVFGCAGNKTSAELVDKDEYVQQQSVIVGPNLRVEKEHNLYSQPGK